jgi:hypothetical protein
LPLAAKGEPPATAPFFKELTMPANPDDPFDSLKLPAQEFEPPPPKPAAPKPPPKKPAQPAGKEPAEAGAKAPPPPPATPPKSLGPKSQMASRLAQEVARSFALSDEARSLFRPGLNTRQYLDLLVAKELYTDATRFLAHALPKREAVWWACQCARKAQGPKPAPPAQIAVTVSERWVVDPSPANHQLTRLAAEAAGYDTPAGCAALAAFCSGDNLGPPQGPVVHPGEYLTARAAGGSVLLVLAQAPPDQVKEFLHLGIDVANGTNRWKRAGA